MKEVSGKPGFRKGDFRKNWFEGKIFQEKQVYRERGFRKGRSHEK